jgi:DNA recombination protein RmuC
MTLYLLVALASAVATFFLAWMLVVKRLQESEKALLGRATGAEAEANALKGAKKDQEEMLSALAAKIFNEQGSKLREDSERGLKSLLNPLKDDILNFRTRIDAVHSTDTQQRAKLEQRLEELVGASGRLSERAENLSKAISGDVKAQGTWGEVKLEDLLEQSGLTSGSEFFAQGEGLGLKFDDGKSARPDFVVLLPGKRHLIIDSKVSMESYLRACASENPQDRKEASKELAQSIRKHVKNLAEKDYAKLDGINAPGFVLMFMPFEGALSLAAEEDRSLVKDAVDREVVIATPTTLFSMMRAVNLIWTQERQNQNVQDIAERAGLLYDKFVDFYAELIGLGKNIQSAQEAYEKAAARLGGGRGNLINQTEDLRRLGAKAKKALPPKAVERALSNHENNISREQELGAGTFSSEERN